MRASPESFSTTGVGGVRIAADRLGDPLAPAVVFLHGGGQTRRSWGRAAAAVAERGWQAITVDLRGHGESDWSQDGDYRVTTFAKDTLEVLRQLPPRPVLVGASLGGFTSMLLAGELSPDAARAVVLVDIVPNMNPSGASRIHSFMYDRMESGFDSLDEVADAIQEYNPHRPRPTDLDGLKTNLRHRDGRWYWHWDPKFIDGTAALPPIEVTEVDRMYRESGILLEDNDLEVTDDVRAAVRQQVPGLDKLPRSIQDIVYTFSGGGQLIVDKLGEDGANAALAKVLRTFAISVDPKYGRWVPARSQVCPVTGCPAAADSSAGG